MSHAVYFRVAIALTAFALAASAAFAELPLDNTWPQWRGPTRDAKAYGAEWPVSISEKHLVKQWRVDLGPGYSSPIVTEDRVFTVETVDKKVEVVKAFDRKTGEELWETKWDGALTVPFFAARNGSWVRATPAYDGEHLYVAGMRDRLVCIDAGNGEIVWNVDFTERYKTPLPTFGFVCSPLVVGDHLYVQAGGGFCKLDRKTGESIWRTMADGGGMNGSAFSSPSLATVAGKEQLLVQSRTELAGVDPESGDVLWQQPIKAFRGMNILTPTAYKNGVFTSAYGGRTKFWELTADEDAGKLAVKEKWDNRLQGYMSSPVVIDDHAYIHLRNKRFACVDLQTGDIKWITGDLYGDYWSMAAQGDRILALDQRGILYLIKASPEKFELIEERKIAEQETWAHIAKTGDQIFIRELNGLVAFQWKAPGE